MGVTSPKSAIVTGGSSGLGRHIAARLVHEGYQVTIVGRDEARLRAAAEWLNGPVHTFAGDASEESAMSKMVAEHVETFGSLDVLLNVVGRSDRGLLMNASRDELESMFRDNVISAWNCSRVALEPLKLSRGVIVNLGSLASRVAPRYLGGYVIAKHALVGFSRQLKMELAGDGVHVGVVCPGPIRRDPAVDEDPQPIDRYHTETKAGVPAEAAQPGGGAKLKGLAPDRVADAVMQCINDRATEIVLPGKVRFLMALNAVSPSLADWFLGRSTS